MQDDGTGAHGAEHTDIAWRCVPTISHTSTNCKLCHHKGLRHAPTNSHPLAKKLQHYAVKRRRLTTSIITSSGDVHDTVQSCVAALTSPRGMATPQNSYPMQADACEFIPGAAHHRSRRHDG
eukprot:1007392-Karenia_brevis.AAC.1